MHGSDVLYGLEFNDQASVHEQVPSALSDSSLTGTLGSITPEIFAVFAALRSIPRYRSAPMAVAPRITDGNEPGRDHGCAETARREALPGSPSASSSRLWTRGDDHPRQPEQSEAAIRQPVTPLGYGRALNNAAVRLDGQFRDFSRTTVSALPRFAMQSDEQLFAHETSRILDVPGDGRSK